MAEQERKSLVMGCSDQEVSKGIKELRSMEGMTAEQFHEIIGYGKFETYEKKENVEYTQPVHQFRIDDLEKLARGLGYKVQIVFLENLPQKPG